MSKTIITPKGPGLRESMSELLAYKDLFITLSIRDFKVKYAQTFLGFFWAIFQQLVTIFFLTIIRVVFIGGSLEPQDFVDISVAVSIWTYFSLVLDQAGNSIIESGGMIKKIYFPRLIIPISKGLVGLIDLAIGLLLLVLVCIITQVQLQSDLLLLLPAILLCVICSVGCGLWISALTIRYRDFKQIVPFALRIGMLVSPIWISYAELIERSSSFCAEAFSISEFTHDTFFNIGYYLNPISGILEMAKESVSPNAHLSPYWYLSGCIALLIFITGFAYFKSVERKMADLV